ncbi:DNA polymerase III alpha subunit [hydrothermal vent metagenome]|uniref:DNA polymerase III subunit alpha n=1 Tax=hydrothermal vent metagenome TaxID=652676 RepID=A0A3B0TKL7_9ZZZZ
MEPAPKFVHLAVRSAYSLLEGALRIPKLVELAAADGMPAVAITDTNNLFGALEFAEAAAKAGVQPIVGLTLSVDFADEDETGRRPKGLEVFPAIRLLAQNEAGYGHLMALSSAAFLDHDPQKPPHVPLAVLKRHGEDLIALTGGAQGPIDMALGLGQGGRAKSRLQTLEAIFGDRLYVELQRHGLNSQSRIEADLVDLAYEAELPLVATNDAHFVSKDDYEAHDALICIAGGRVVAEDDRPKLTPEHRFKTADEMVELFADLPEALANTCEVARRVTGRPVLRDPMLPNFGAGEDDADVTMVEGDELERQARDGLAQRLAAHGTADGFTEADYRQRLDEEVGIIRGMGFPGYFLIVADIIKWSKAQGIPVGPGRGSGAGSLVAFVLTITDLDPLRFGLLFERFLNPERVSMPDFDIDFCPDRRDEVIGYIRDKYGSDRVAQIITFGKLQARAVLRDVGRVLQMPYGQVDRLCKMVPNNPANPVTLEEAIAGETSLQEERDGDDTVARLLKIGLRLEGLYRHASTHAAGVVIADRPLVDLVPLYRDPRSEMLVTQFNMKWVEQAGLVKFDILGLKTLTVLEKTTGLLARRGVTIDLGSLPLDDKPTYEMLARAETAGVFQFESAGMRDLLFKADPSNFEDLIALIALFRPGPMENIPKYLACKHGEEKPEFLHKTIVPVVADTYGVIIYQEQVMQIAQVFAGYSLGEADLLRRAMGKKIKSEMDAQRARFIEGAAAGGVEDARAVYVFDLVNKFAGYGFNKSHSAAYALIAYQTAYLKANHPVEFLAASMTLDMANTDKLSVFREEAMRLDIAIDPPSINASGVDFTVENGRIAYGLAAIKNVGRQAVETIVDQRTSGGDYRGIGDFAGRIDPQAVNRRALENLAKSGAFDKLEPNRAAVLGGLDRILQTASRAIGDRTAGQNDLFVGGEGGSAPDLRLPATEPWDPLEQLTQEFEALGFYLSGHPLDAYKLTLTRANVSSWRDFETAARDHGHSAGRIAGTVTSRRDRRARSGSRFAFVGFSDQTGQFEAVVFADVLAEAADLLNVGKAVILGVEADIDGERVRLRVQSVEAIGEGGKPCEIAALKIFIEDAEPLNALGHRLQTEGRGEVSVVVMDKDTGREVELRLAKTYKLGPQIERAIKAVPGVVALEAS